MAAEWVKELPEVQEWLYELKLDGNRTRISKAGAKVHIRSRIDKDLTRAYPRVIAAAQELIDQIVLDCQVTALGPDGRPSFQRSATSRIEPLSHNRVLGFRCAPHSGSPGYKLACSHVILNSLRARARWVSL
jgi:ATP-dependent DNA ligase